MGFNQSRIAISLDITKFILSSCSTASLYFGSFSSYIYDPIHVHSSRNLRCCPARIISINININIISGTSNANHVLCANATIKRFPKRHFVFISFLCKKSETGPYNGFPNKTSIYIHLHGMFPLPSTFDETRG